ncbi:MULTISPECIES: L-histidine N(alpha)-methyltransferase [Rhodomicrobium]|uniref:L-histidine N(alpha)-methyltransferase n=1 Tax=Rhodomicrobium TaxID=1068 RepID=UPI000B4B9D57|nr:MULTISPECIES: L-histidine N(alpha)-methyltransferase [Rhodomicrobium]
MSALEATWDGHGCDFADAVIAGLRGTPKSIPSRFFYDARGSELFERITELEEYYPTGAEIALLDAHAEEMAALAGPGVCLVEFGSGSSRKTDRLIEALPRLASYVPIDISEAALAGAVSRLRERFPGLRVTPLHGDFSAALTLPRSARTQKKLGFFPGSTIGNLTHAEAAAFLENCRVLLGANSGFLVGVDLKKSTDILLPAYNDRLGVTAAFNLNLLARVNRELGGDFDLSAFAHEAIYNAAAGRIEMHLRSCVPQSATVLGESFAFAEGETIHTENSYKYTVAEFEALAASAGWASRQVWTDPKGLFSAHYLTPA